MRFIASAVWWLLAGAIAHAQQSPRSDSLPRDLVIALLGGSLGGRQVDVHAGLADDSLPAELFRDALILGFADYRVVATTVAYFPYDPKGTIDTIKARLVARGWAPAPEDPDTLRGFVTAFGGSRPLAICRDRLVIVPTVAVRTLNRTLAVISRQGSQGGAYLCGRDDVMMSRRARTTPASETPLPTLTPPAGMEPRGMGSSGAPSADRSMTMSTQLSGSVPLRQIISHYSDLFTRNGWTKVEEQLATSIGVVTFEITAKGASWHCALVVSVPASDAADVHLTLRIR